jgi:hypothetical protein
MSCVHVVLAGLLAITPGVGVVRSEEHKIKLESGPYFCKWEPTFGVLLCMNNSDSVNTAAVTTYDLNGAQKLRVFPLRDFPGAKELNVWDVTAAPDEGVAITGVLLYGPKDGRLVTLIYGSQGQLLKLWDMKPYHQHMIAADRAGNVFGFGDRIDMRAGTGGPDFPLVVKYSPEGKILKGFLPQSTFDRDVTDADPETGPNRLYTVQEEVVIFLAKPKEVFWFDSDGKELRRIALGSTINGIMKSHQGTTAEIMNITVTSDHEFLVQLKIYPASPTSENTVVILARISADGSSVTIESSIPLAQSIGFFKGFSPDGRLIFLTPGAHSTLSLYNMDLH